MLETAQFKVFSKNRQMLKTSKGLPPSHSFISHLPLESARALGMHAVLGFLPGGRVRVLRADPHEETVRARRCAPYHSEPSVFLRGSGYYSTLYITYCILKENSRKRVPLF